MLKTIVKKEILENILSYRFPLFFLISAVLIISSLYVHHLDYSKRINDYNEQIRLSREELASSRSSDLHFGRIPLKGFLPPSPLSIFAGGFETSLPKFYEFQADGFKPGDTSVGDESILSVLGKFDFVFIVQMVVSLIVLLFASDLIAGEKELGTLRGILANSVPRHSLLVGKLLGGYTALWMPFLITFLLGLILLGLRSFPFAESGILGRLILIFAATSLFILAYFTLGLMISASSARARTALVSILLVWILFQLVIPRLSDMVASVVYPVRTETVVSMQKSVLVKALEYEKAKTLGQKYEAIFGRGGTSSTKPDPPAKVEEWNVFKANVEAQVQERKTAQLRDLEDTYRREKRIQRTIAGNLSLVSPSAAFTRLLTDMCGTGEIDKEKYLDAVKVHQQTLDAELYSHVKKTTLIFPSGGTSSSSSIDGMVDPKTLPNFSVRKAGLSEVFARNWGSLVSLAFWLIVPFAVAYVRFLRYDVR